MEQNLLRQVAGIIRRCEDELLNTLYPAQGALPESAMQAYLDSTPRDAAAANISGGLHAASSAPSSSSFTRNMQRPQAGSSTLTQSSEQQMVQGQQYTPDAPGQGTGLPWDSSEWIDWNAVFPPGPDVQGPDRGEQFQALNTVTSVWT